MTRKEIEGLLSRLCIDLGFCLPPEEEDKILNTSPESVEDFVDAVFRGEGLNPEYAERHLYRRVRDVVAEAFDHRQAGRIG